MINTSDFADRLKIIMNYYDESASSFAEKVGVQRSSISHILSGRNKPSLDFLMKILNAYPEVELYWLLNGKGIFPKSEQKKIPSASISSSSSQNNAHSISTNEKGIEKIVIFYKDGTFKSYKP